MYFLYADESGDIGLQNSPTKYFALSGFVVHELKWHQTLDAIIEFRKYLRDKYGLKLREEIHAAEFLHKPGNLRRIEKSIRLKILRETIEFQATLHDVNIINILINKTGKPKDYDIFEVAWTTLIQRFHNTMSYSNFPGPKNPQDYGILVVDKTDEKKLRNTTRKIRRYNPVPNMGNPGSRPIPITTIVEDAIHRNSLHSYFVQLADVNAYFLMQKKNPCKYVKRKGGKNYFNRLDSVLCKKACKKDPQGIVTR